MQWIKILKTCSLGKKGTTIQINNRDAAMWIKGGYAEEGKEPKKTGRPEMSNKAMSAS